MMFVSLLPAKIVIFATIFHVPAKGVPPAGIDDPMLLLESVELPPQAPIRKKDKTVKMKASLRTRISV